MIIDFQAHIYPRRDETPRWRGDLEAPDPHSGMTYFYDKKLGCRINTATFQGQDIERRLAHMDQLGIDIHVLTIPAPGADRFEGEALSVLHGSPTMPLRRSAANIPTLHRLFHLPTESIRDSLDELERRVNDLGLRGFGCFANLNGKPLDREELLPIYERLAKYKLPVYIHPTAPLATEATGIDIMPTLIFGWAFDSTVAMTRLVYGRVLERFPKINFVVADVGGVLAFFAQRAINIYSGRTEEIRQRYGLKENPLDSFRTVLRRHRRSPGVDITMCEGFLRRRQAGARDQLSLRSGGRMCLVKNSLKAIDGLELSEAEKDKILGGNAADILGLGAA